MFCGVKGSLWSCLFYSQRPKHQILKAVIGKKKKTQFFSSVLLIHRLPNNMSVSPSVCVSLFCLHVLQGHSCPYDCVRGT